jgi:Family of unknown function (DUF695)
MSATPNTDDCWILKEFTRPGFPEIAYFRKNDAPTITPGHPDYPFQVYLTLNYIPKDQTGLPSPADTEALYRFEESAFALLEHDQLAVMVATVVQSGVKDHLFYTRDPEEFSRRADRLASETTVFSPAYQIQHDPAWSIYHDFP